MHLHREPDGDKVGRPPSAFGFGKSNNHRGSFDLGEHGVDAIAQALDAVKAGRLDATVFQDAVGQGRGAIDTAILLASKQPFEKEVMIPFQVVTRENVDTFLKK